VRLLIVEDDSYLAQSIMMALEAQSYSTELASDGYQADLALTNDYYDLIVLDLTLPYLDGLQVLQRLRSRGQSMPVLILSARDSIQDRVAGLDNGANDYLVKPFELPEFEARVRALLRKERWMNLLEVKYGDIVFNTHTKEVHAGGEKLELTARELTLLEILLSNSGKLVTKRDLLKRLAECDLELTVNALDIVIYRLRKKLEHSSCAVQTMRGIGYTLLNMVRSQ
jgi:two-component system, OmpR family, response regulator